MKKNVGSSDKIIRYLIAIAAALLIIFSVVKGIWAIIIGIVGGIMLVTALTGFCGLYTICGTGTCKTKKE